MNQYTYLHFSHTEGIKHIDKHTHKQTQTHTKTHKHTHIDKHTQTIISYKELQSLQL